MGYETRNGTLSVNEEEAEVIRWAFARIVAGDSIVQATQSLNRRWPKYEGKRGSVGFTASTVSKWVRNPTYVGEGAERKVAPFRGAPKDTFLIPAPAIIDRPTFERAAASLNRTVGEWKRSRSATTADTRTYPLSGSHLRHLHASGTEHDLYGLTRKVAGADVRYYRCSTANTRYHERYNDRDEFDPCPGWGQHPKLKDQTRTSVRAAEIEAFVALQIVEHFRSPEAIRDLVFERDIRATAAGGSKEVLDSAVAALKELDEEAGRNVHLFSKGYIKAERLDAELARIEEEKAEVEYRIERIQAEEKTLQGLASVIDSLRSSSFSLLATQPESGTETVTDSETGATGTASAGWVDVLGMVEGHAQDVLGGLRKELSETVIEWMAEMVDALELTTIIEGDAFTTSGTVMSRGPSSPTALTRDKASARRYGFTFPQVPLDVL